jgi:ABC-type sugar transport system permease subunit/ABC-type glycerol-3-phosphate transport system substrate-binding protein
LKRLLLVWLLLVSSLGAVELDIPVFAGAYGTAFYADSARRFEALRPGVKIRIYGDPRIQDQISVRVVGGDYPDAASAAYVLWPELIRAGKVLDLRPWLAGPNWEGDARWSDTFYPSALESWKIDGRVGGLPVSFSAWSIFYNRALFRAHGWSEPKTWGEFYALCEKIQASGMAPLSMPGISWLYPDAFLRSAAYDLLGSQGWAALNALTPGARLDPRYLRAAGVEQRIMQHYVERGWEGESHTGAELSFLQGRVAMTVSGSWLVNEMAGKIPEGFELGTMNFPVFPDGVADPSAIQTGSDCFFVFATGHPERERLAIDFLRFLTSRERAEAFVRALDSPAAVRGVPLAAFSERMRATAGIIARAKEAFPFPNLMIQPPAIRQEIIAASQQLTTGKISAAEFGRRLENAAASDRAHRADPNRIDLRHPVAAAVLLTAVVGLLAGLAASAWAKGRRGGGAAGPAQGYLGPLRPGVAAGFVGPAFLLYAALVLGPGLTALAWAFTRWNGIGPRAWAGLFNFKWLLFESDIFWFALKNNLYLMVVPALFVIPLALVFAGLIHRGVAGAKLFRGIVLFPNLLGGIAAALLWLSAYQPHGGLVNAGVVAAGRALHSPRLIAFDGYPWLAPTHLYLALIPIYIWMACGFNLILYLAAMESIDPQLYEAAEIDGAPPWRQFFTITLPLIWEVICLSAVFLVIGGLNAFEMVWLLTSQDPPPQTHTLGTLLVTSMFKDFAIGRATALAAILFVLVFSLSAAVLQLLQRDPIEN